MAENIISIFVRARENATKVFKQVKASTEGANTALKKLSRTDISKLERDFRKFQQESKKLGIDVSGVNRQMFRLERVRLDSLVSNVRRLRRESRLAAERLSDLRDKAKQVNDQARQVLRQSLVPVVASGAAIRSAGIFSTQIAEISTLVDSARTSNDQLRRSVLNLSNEFGRSRADVATGLYTAISAGAQQGAESVGFLEVALRQSIGGVSTVEESVKGLSSIINAFNLSFTDAEEVSDRLFATVKGGQTTIRELSRFIFQAAPVAATLDVELSDLLATTQALTLGGTPTSVAFTQIRAAMVGLTRETPELRKVLDSLDVENFKALAAREGLPGAFQAVSDAVDGSESALIKLVGSIEGANAIFGVTGDNVDKVTKALNDQANSAGSAQVAQEKVSQELGATINRLTTAFSNLFVEIGDGIGKAFEPFLQVVTRGIIVLADFIAANGDTIGPLVAVTGAVIGLRIALASLAITTSVIVPALAAMGLNLTKVRTAILASSAAAGVFSKALAALGVVARVAAGPIGWVVLVVSGLGTIITLMSDDGPKAIVGFQKELERLQSDINQFDADDFPIEIKKIEGTLESLRLEIDKTTQKLESFGQGPRGGRFARRGQVIADKEAELDELILLEIEFEEKKAIIEGRAAALAEVEAERARKKKEDEEARAEARRLALVRAGQKAEAAIRSGNSALVVSELDRARQLEQQAGEVRLREAEERFERERTTNAAALDNLFNTRRSVIENNGARELALLRAQFEAAARAGDEAIQQAATESERETARLNGQVQLDRLATSIELARRRQVEALAQLETELNQSRFGQIERDFSELTENTSRQLENLNNLRANGAVGAREAEQQALEIQERTNEEIQALIRRTQEYLQLFPNDTAAVAKLEDLKAAITDVKTTSSELRNELRGAFESSFSQFFVDLAEGAKTTKEIFQDLADSIKQQLIRIAADRAAAQLATAFFGPAATGGQVSTQAASGGLIGFAAGGPIGRARGAISGPGTGTSDSILARLSNGEYVVKAQAVKHYGANILEHMNRMQLPKPNVHRNLPITRPPVRRFMTGGEVQRFSDVDSQRNKTVSKDITINAPMNITTNDADSFNRSEKQIQAAQERRLRTSSRRLR